METLWSRRFSLASERTRSSAIRELLNVVANPDVISFAGGLPSTEAFPIARFREAAERILSYQAAQALQYGSTEGYLPLREMIARHTGRYGIIVGPENILLTTGSQQALDLIGKVFINPGDGVLTERPTYLGALQAWNGHEPEYLSLDVDDHGLDTRDLDRALRSGPKFIYLLPNFQNPTGVTLSLERRKLLVERADHYGIPIIEDDPYGQLRYEGEHLPPLVALDAQARGDDPYSGNVIYLSTFSKILAPGLRLGWVVAPAEVIRRLVAAKQGADLHTSNFVQMLAYEVARGGFMDEHVRKIRGLYRTRRDAMLAAMKLYFPLEVQWPHPAGGLFLWVTLPAGIDARELLHLSLVERVAFVPGSHFFPDAPLNNTLRLNFSNVEPDRIEEGIRRLAFVLRRMLDSVSPHPQGRFASALCG
jgi:2-aminoadipate transaminase